MVGRPKLEYPIANVKLASVLGKPRALDDRAGQMMLAGHLGQ
jgi:hypothetical protein